MAWPSQGYTLGDTPDEVADGPPHVGRRRERGRRSSSRSAWSSCPADLAVAEAHLHPDVELVPAALDDAWMRDIGPTFVRSADGTRLGAVDWVFNGWGAQSWATWEHDARVGAFVGGLTGAEVIGSSLVNEGGGIHVDGLGHRAAHRDRPARPGSQPGTDPRRRRGRARPHDRRDDVRVAAAGPDPRLRRVRHPWARRHRRDDREPRRRAAARRSGTPRTPTMPCRATLRELLEDARDARGERFEVVGVPAPRTLADAEGPVDWSYINHLVVNDGVIACTFGDEQDDASLGGPRRGLPGAPRGRGRCAAALRPRRRHPLHHPAAARPLRSSGSASSRPERRVGTSRRDEPTRRRRLRAVGRGQAWGRRLWMSSLMRTTER